MPLIFNPCIANQILGRALKRFRYAHQCIDRKILFGVLDFGDVIAVAIRHLGEVFLGQLRTVQYCGVSTLQETYGEADFQIQNIPALSPNNANTQNTSASTVL